MKPKAKIKLFAAGIAKCPTGIRGLDEITDGGLPQGRPTLVCGAAAEQSEVGVSSLMDTWLLLQMVPSASERNRVLYLLKSRGMAHSNQAREFVLTKKGIELVDVHAGPGPFCTGAARLSREARDQTGALAQQQAGERRQRELAQAHGSVQAQVAALQIRLANLAAELCLAVAVDKQSAATA